MKNRASPIGNFRAGSYGVAAGCRLTLIFGIAAVAFLIVAADLISPTISRIAEQNPVRGTAFSQVKGVLEIQRALDEEAPFLIHANRSSILGLTAATIGGLGLVFLITMVVANMSVSRTEKRERVLLRNQMIERRQTAEALDESNRLLQETRDMLKKTQEEQNVEQERLRALEQMARSIAHDFNNALTPLMGFCSLLLESRENWDDPEYIDAQLRIINAAGEDAAGVAARLKKLYRKDDKSDQLNQLGRKEPVVQAVSFD